MLGFNFQQLTVPISQAPNTFVGRFVLYRGDVLESFVISLQSAAGIAPHTDLAQFRAIADNNNIIATGIGMTLVPVGGSQLEVVPTVNLPWSFDVQGYTGFNQNLATGAANLANLTYVAFMKHQINTFLICDETTRDIGFVLDTTPIPDFVDGFISINIRRPLVSGDFKTLV